MHAIGAPRRLVALLVLAALLTAGCGTGGTAGSPAPSLADPTAAAMPLVTKFFDLIHAKDVEGLQAFLSPAFQVERADGTGTGRDDYLAKLPTVDTYQISDLTATQSGGTLVARYLATVTGTVNGKPYTPGPAPRLSVFAWNGSEWQLVAHANFNPLTG